ncbi:SDR family oxidoreductase [Amycolatopsis sp. NPDC088138]|uniref:SDR family oxidoreductase n=1 Tax=Amycolatopsis sp. NPDC088138 TaxID=3363938 RepID=UPI0038120BDB
MSGIEGKVVAITGASGGIGEAVARLLAERGAAVVVGARRADRLDELVGDITDRGGRAVACATDVTVQADVERLVARAVEEFGRLDVFVGNAGISKIGPVADLDVAGWSAMIDVNLRGVLHGIAAALPVFQRQGRGHLVTTVSTSGLKITPTMAVYAATKNAVRTLLEGLRQESTDGALRTTAISPGFVRTDLADSIDNAEVRAEIRRGIDEFAIAPAAVARAVAFAVEQPYDVEIGELVIRPTVQG